MQVCGKALHKSEIDRMCLCEVSWLWTRESEKLIFSKVYFYSISNLTQNKTFVMEFQHT